MVLDIGFIAQPPQPDFQLFLGLPLTYGFTGSAAPVFVGFVLFAAIKNLYEVPAKAALHRLADFLNLPPEFNALKVDWIITNPPFTISENIVSRLSASRASPPPSACA